VNSPPHAETHRRKNVFFLFFSFFIHGTFKEEFFKRFFFIFTMFFVFVLFHWIRNIDQSVGPTYHKTTN